MILKADQASLRATGNRSRERLSMAGNGHEGADLGAGNGTLSECSNLTRRQLLIWMGQKLNPGVPSYNMMMTFTIKGEIQAGRFLEAFQALIDHTDALRTVIEEVNGVPQQRVLAHMAGELDYFDFSKSQYAEADLKRWLEQRAVMQFNLEECLFDSALIKMASDRFVLYLNLHHIIIDAWSFSLLYRRLAEFYERASESQLPNIPPQRAFKDYMAYERAYRGSRQYKQAQAYWQEKLSEPFEPTRFYGKVVHQKSKRTQRVTCELGIKRSQKLREIAQRADVRAITPNLSLFNLFATLLSAYVFRVGDNRRNREIRIGTPHHNRGAAFKDTIGLFMEVCPLKIELDARDTFLSLLKKVMSESYDVLRYSQHGISNPQHNKAFDVMMNYHHMSFGDFLGLPTEIEWLHSGYWDGGDTLALQIHDFKESGSFVLHFDFNGDVFDEQTRQDAIRHFLYIVDGLIEDRTQAISRVNLLSPEERARLLVEFNQTKAAYPADQTFVQLFEAQARRTPDQIAVTYKGQALTYEQLNRKANQLAHYLQGLGVGAEELVGICVARSLEMLIGILGILKAGAAYVPLDPTHPKERLRFMLQNSGARLLLTQQALVGRTRIPPALRHFGKLSASQAQEPRSEGSGKGRTRIPPALRHFGKLSASQAQEPRSEGSGKGRTRIPACSDGRTRIPACSDGRTRIPACSKESIETICLDTQWEKIEQACQHNPISGATPDNLAYVIYTSGSTGQPKGVMIPHRGLVNYLSWCVEAYDVASGKGAPVHSSISFDLTISSLFAPLLAGRQVALLPQELDVEALTRSLQEKQEFSLVKITPAHLELLNRQLSPKNGSAKAPPTPERAERTGQTNAFVIGGEALFAETLAFWQKKAPETMLINEYGPTETVVGCCVYQVPLGKHKTGAIPIGRPIANTQLYILDRHLEPTPIGVPGELYIGGVGVARGYKNRPALTAEKFIPNPFSDEPGTRLYKSGDLARYQADGTIEYLGRVDHQVKIRGFRVELGEIEAVLNEHSAVSECVVVPTGDSEGLSINIPPVAKKLASEVADDRMPGEGTRLVAYLVANEGTKPPSLIALRRFLKKKLPNYMIPALFIFLEALPLTPNGKINRRALPAPDWSRLDLCDNTFIAPRTPQETRLAAIWGEVLRLPQVGIHDNFFELGGHSLLAAQAVSQIRHTFEVDMPLSRLFETPTVADLAKVIEQQTGE